IRAFLDARVHMLSSGVRRGCLMINTCVELAPHDVKVAEQLQSGLATMRLGFEIALNRALEQGEIPQDANVSELAVFLNAQVAGMTVMAKNQASQQELQAVADQALRSLR
ncbi:MAG: TetR family transcriptional regulator C-terminal domain-containing protein, partial [Pseudomonadota bacterium]